ncbi:MAG: YciI family protein [Candidatus Kariarchaeaceae archaeon]|jgi:uncharacterized protein YciI
MNDSRYFLFILKPNFQVEKGTDLSVFINNVDERGKSIIDSHFQYMKKLDNEERFLLGGPCLDVSKLIFIIKGDSFEEATGLVQNDPTIKSDFFRISSSSEFNPSVGLCLK